MSTDVFKKYIKEHKSGKAHAVLSASGAERWIGCPGSVGMSQGIESEETQWSVAGNNAHTLLQFMLDQGKVASELALDRPEAKAFKKHIDFSEAQFQSVKYAADYVWSEQRRMKKKYGAYPETYVERKVELPGVGFGTADVILYQPFGSLHVMDYKSGKGIVEPEENKQGLYYAIATAEAVGWDFDNVTITIIQPNVAHPNGMVRSWTTTHERLKEAHKEFLEAAKATKKKNAPLVTNIKWCWFCPARSICPKQKEQRGAKLLSEFKEG